MKLITDLFMTEGPPGFFKWDITNPAWSAVPWLATCYVYLLLGLYTAVAHPDTFDLMKFATGAGALFGGGGIGVMFHSRANT